MHYISLFCTGGKRDEKLILPVNSSVSVTLSQNQVNNISTTLCENLFMPKANNKAADQPAHLQSDQCHCFLLHTLFVTSLRHVKHPS